MLEVRIDKFRLDPFDVAPVCMMQHGARVLSVHQSNEQIYMWAEVLSSNPLVRHKYLVLETGDRVPLEVLSWQRLGTVHIPIVHEVWHIYMDPTNLWRP